MGIVNESLLNEKVLQVLNLFDKWELSDKDKNAVVTTLMLSIQQGEQIKLQERMAESMMTRMGFNLDDFKKDA